MLGVILPAAPRNFRSTLITNASANSREVVERVTEAGATVELVRALGLSYPPDIFSLSHVAIPFPPTDGLYGFAPDLDNFGIELGAMASRGEVGVLIVNLDSLLRISSNPFFSYLIERVDEVIPRPAQKAMLQ